MYIDKRQWVFTASSRRTVGSLINLLSSFMAPGISCTLSGWVHWYLYSTLSVLDNLCSSTRSILSYIPISTITIQVGIIESSLCLTCCIIKIIIIILSIMLCDISKTYVKLPSRRCRSSADFIFRLTRPSQSIWNVLFTFSPSDMRILRSILCRLLFRTRPTTAIKRFLFSFYVVYAYD